jgi:hypothetical protein
LSGTPTLPGSANSAGVSLDFGWARFLVTMFTGWVTFDTAWSSVSRCSYRSAFVSKGLQEFEVANRQLKVEIEKRQKTRTTQRRRVAQRERGKGFYHTGSIESEEEGLG